MQTHLNARKKDERRHQGVTQTQKASPVVCPSPLLSPDSIFML